MAKAKETRTELWERLWGTYMEKLKRVDDLRAAGRYGYQLRMPLKAVEIAETALLKEFPEADIYTDPGLFEERKRSKPEMGLHTKEEKIQAVDLSADALARGLEAAAENNLFGLAKEIGYLQSIVDLAVSEGVDSLATIAAENQLRLLKAFEASYGQLGSPSLGMHTKKERLEAFDMANEAYHRGVDAANNMNALGLASEIGYLTAIRELARKERAGEVVAMVERQVLDLLDRMERKFPEWAGGLRR